MSEPSINLRNLSMMEKYDCVSTQEPIYIRNFCFILILWTFFAHLNTFLFSVSYWRLIFTTYLYWKQKHAFFTEIFTFYFYDSRLLDKLQDTEGQKLYIKIIYKKILFLRQYFVILNKLQGTRCQKLYIKIIHKKL